jgi:hypothetical protein
MALSSPDDLPPAEVGRAGFDLRLSPHLQFPNYMVARMTHADGGAMLMVDLDRDQATELRDWLTTWLTA